MKAIAHANNWSLTLAFHIIFTRAPVNFTWAQARVCPGVATPLTWCPITSATIVLPLHLLVSLVPRSTLNGVACTKLEI